MATINAVGNGLANATGTGSFVGSISPTIVTPVIAQIDDVNGNAILQTVGSPLGVNYIEVNNQISGQPPGLISKGSDTNVSFGLLTQGTGLFDFRTMSNTPIMIASGTNYQHGTTFATANTAVSRTVTIPDATGTLLMTGVAINSVPSIAFSSTSGIIGTTTNDNAAAGSVGEYLDSGSQSGTYTVSTTVYNAASISAGAGDWDIYIELLPAFTSFNSSSMNISISTVSATLASQLMGNAMMGVTGLSGVSQLLGETSMLAFKRVSLATTTTIYLCTSATWSGGSAPTFSAQIVARRTR